MHRVNVFTAAALTGTLTLVPTAAMAAQLVGTSGDDTLRGTSSHDRMDSRRGDDNLAGRAGGTACWPVAARTSVETSLTAGPAATPSPSRRVKTTTWLHGHCDRVRRGAARRGAHAARHPQLTFDRTSHHVIEREGH